MKSNYLISNKYKIPGWILLIVGLVVGVFLMLSEFESEAMDVGFTDFRLRCAFPAPVDAEESSWMVESPGLIHVELVKAKRDAEKLPEGFEWWKSAFVVSAVARNYYVGGCFLAADQIFRFTGWSFFC